MRIKTIIVLSYITLITSIAVIMSISHFIVVRNATVRNVDSVIEYEEKLALKNIEAANSIFLPYGRAHVQMETRIVADDISSIISRKKIKDNAALKKDKKLRKAATQFIHSENEVVGYMELFDSNGTGLLSPNPKVEGVNYKKWEKKFPKLYTLIKEALTGKNVEGFYVFYGMKPESYEEKFNSLVHVRETDYILASTVYLKKYLAPVTEKIKNSQRIEYNMLKKEIDDTLYHSLVSVTIANLIIIFFMCISAFIAGFWLADKISKPIVKLHKGVQKLGEGDFQSKIQEQGFFETVRLAQTFNSLGEKLHLYMDNLKKEIGAREAYQSEIKIVAQIQQAILPQIGEEFKSKNFSIHAELIPAKEAAGDFYDFFFLDKDKLALLVADVSGKGLSAAFFMTIAKTLLNNICKYYPNNPESALEEVNNILAKNNSESMFVTLFLAYYDINSGEMTYANAGHHAAIKISEDGQLSEFGVFKNLVLGFLPGTLYRQGKEKLKKGEKLILYTDGAFEAFSSANGEIYGEDRLKRNFQEHNSDSLEKLCEKTVASVKDFEKGPRSDDITLLAFKRES